MRGAIVKTKRNGRPIAGFIELSPNGDPYGRGFTGTETVNRDDRYGVYRGDIGAQTRAWWRAWAARNDYVLIES